MITISILLVMWFIVSCYNIQKKASEFVFDISVIEYAGLLFGGVTITLWILYIAFTYLP